MTSGSGTNRWSMWACVLLLGAGCNAFDDPAADPGSARLDGPPPPDPSAAITAGAGAVDAFDNAEPIAEPIFGAPRAPAGGPVPPPLPFGDTDFVGAELSVRDGHLQGQMPGVALDDAAVIQSAWFESWRSVVTEHILTLELHANGDPGAGMIAASMYDLSAVSALLRAPDESVEGEPVPTEVTITEVEVTGCSGDELHNYDWDQHTADGEVTMELDPDDPDAIHVRATATWDDGTVSATAEGSAILSRSALLPLLE